MTLLTTVQKHPWFMFLSLSVLIMIYLTTYYLLPLANEIKSLVVEIKSARELIAEAENFDLIISKLRAEKDSLDNLMKGKPIEIFQHTNNSDVIEKISRWSNKAKIREIRSLKPLKIRKVDDVLIMPFTIEMRGGYHQVGKFLNFLETDINLIKINNLEIVRRNKIVFTPIVSVEFSVIMLDKE